MKTRICVNAIIEKNGEFLFGKKLKDVGPYPNSWLLIGGGVRLEKETLEEALRREIKEEANIKVGGIKHVSFDEDYEPDKNKELTHYVFLVFKAKYKSGKEKPGDDIVELKWVSKQELKDIHVSRPSVKLFRKLGWI